MVGEHLRDQMYSRVTIRSGETFYHNEENAEREQMTGHDNTFHHSEKLVRTPIVPSSHL
jgi:hypothetical protein